MSQPTTTANTTPIAPDLFAAALTDLSVSILRLKLLEIRNSISHLRSSNAQLLPFALGTETAVGGEPGVPDPDCADAIRENESVIERMDERIRLIRAEVEGRGLSWDEFEAAPVARKDGDSAATAPVADSAWSSNAKAGPTVNGATNGVAAALDEEDRIATGRETSVGGAKTSGSQQRGGDVPRHPAWSDGTFQTGVIRNGVLHYDTRSGQQDDGAASGGGSSDNIGSSNTTEGQSVATGGPAARGGALTDEQLRRAVEDQMRRMDVKDDDDKNANQEEGLFL